MMQYTTIAFLTTLFLLLIFLRTRLVSFALDQPNERSLHQKAIPRTGGVALMLGVLSAYVFMSIDWIWIAAIGLLMIISLADDVWGLPARYRLLSHLVVSAAFIGLLAPNLTLVIILLLALALGWMINLYNFMDGSDGLAGGMAVFGFGFYAVAAYLANDLQITLMAASIVASSFAFLCFNFHPARIFMGDAGSIPLGFMGGALGFYGYARGLWPFWFPMVIFSPFIIDASVTLLKRLFRGEKVWMAHRNHYYQRLVRLGAGHRNTAIAQYILMLAAGSSAVWVLGKQQVFVYMLLITWTIIYVMIMYSIDVRWRCNKND